MMRFEDLEAWQRARKLVKEVYDLTRASDLVRDFGLSNQTQRASVSIMSNIAEGFERLHVAEKVQFYNTARGSCAEVRSLLYVIEDNYPAHSKQSTLLRDDAVQTGKLLSGLVQSTERRRPVKGR
jgi:four helix bundle protein